MPVIAYRRQPWAFVDTLVAGLCPDGFVIVPVARDEAADERARVLANADFLMGSRRANGVPVAHFGDAMASVVAEHTLLLVLAVLRRLVSLDAAVRAGAWRTGEPVLHELRGKASRGAVVDQSALVAALAAGALAGAGLDVLDPEPPEPTDPLLVRPNVVFTPHNAGQAAEVWPRIVQTCFSNIARVARGEPAHFLARKHE